MYTGNLIGSNRLSTARDLSCTLTKHVIVRITIDRIGLAYGRKLISVVFINAGLKKHK